MITGVTRRRTTLLVLTAATACTPALDPPWVLARARELGMRVEVVAQGPYGLSLDDTRPSVNEALPLDTVEITPFVAGPDGEVAVGDLDPQWYLCREPASCLLLAEPNALPPCDVEFLLPEQTCALSGDDTLTLTLGDFTPAETPEAVFAINSPPSVGLVASTDQGPGTDACLGAIGARESLEGCLWTERTLSLGSVGEVVESLELLGYELELSESLVPLLGVPRNHNPSVQEFQVTVDGEATMHATGSTVVVPRRAAVVVQYLPSDDDIDRYEVEIDGATVQLEDQLGGRWFASREVTEFDDRGINSLVWQAERTEPVRIHFVVRDDRRAEAWGWLDFEPQ